MLSLPEIRNMVAVVVVSFRGEIRLIRYKQLATNERRETYINMFERLHPADGKDDHMSLGVLSTSSDQQVS